jgi:hypothetical protein
MLRSIKEMEGYAIGATDGTIGKVTNFYFDDLAWVIRYLVVETGDWLSSRKVLISPIAIGQLNRTERVLSVAITKEQVRSSPDVDTESPMSWQNEVRYLEHYGYPKYWGGTGIWGQGTLPSSLLSASRKGAGRATTAVAEEGERDDSLLRDCNAIMKYRIHATDGDVGELCGLLVDEDFWAIRFLVVETGDWWAGHQMLIATERIDEVDWPGASVAVDLTRQLIKDAPPYNSTLRLDSREETGIYQHLGRPGHRSGEAPRGPLRSRH